LIYRKDDESIIESRIEQSIMNITAYSNTEGNRVCATHELPQYIQKEGTTIWVDLTTTDDEGVRVLRDVFKFHPLAIEDTLNQRQRPKVEGYADYLFVILNTIKLTDDEEIEFQEMDAFVGSNYIVTVHDKLEPIVQEMQTRIDRSNGTTLMSAGYLLYVMLDAMVDEYFPVVDELGEAIEEIEEAVLQKPDKKMLERAFRLRRTLSEMWRVVNHQRNMFTSLMHHHEMFAKNEVLQYYLRDVYDHLIVVSDTLTTFRDLATGIVELYLSAVSNRLNIVVTRLTIVTIVIGAMTVISGFYGMNFENHTTFWPPLNAEWGVAGVLAIMLVATGILLAIFYRSQNVGE
jgi:magnesium transporter